MNALDVLCAQLTRDLFAIAKFLLILHCFAAITATFLAVVDQSNSCSQTVLPLSVVILCCAKHGSDMLYTQMQFNIYSISLYISTG